MAGVFPPYTYWLIPVNMMLMVLSVFVALIQTFVFILLSQLYLSEVSHGSHEEHADDAEHAHGSDHGHAHAEEVVLAA
jgi:hypothetical protein